MVCLGAIAMAGNFGPHFANGPTHRFKYDNLTSQMNNASDYARNNDLSPTRMDAPKTSDHGNSDVHVMDNHYDWNYAGTAQCMNPQDSQVCNHFHVKFNMKYDYTWSQAKSLACHEFGHTVGLRHDNSRSTCMHSDDKWPVGYSDHDRNHINNRY